MKPIQMFFLVMLYCAHTLYAADITVATEINYYDFTIKRSNDALILNYVYATKEREVVIEKGLIDGVPINFPVVVLHEYPRTFHPVFYFNPYIDRKEKYGPWVIGNDSYELPLKTVRPCLIKVCAGEPLIIDEDLTITFGNARYELEKTPADEKKNVVIEFVNPLPEELGFWAYEKDSDPRVEKTITSFALEVTGKKPDFRSRSEQIYFNGKEIFYVTPFFTWQIQNADGQTQLVHHLRIAVTLPLKNEIDRDH